MKRYYDFYGHLLGKPYDDGDYDCYGLVRRFVQDAFGIETPNYGRSADFFRAGIDLIGPFIEDTEYKVVDVPLHSLQFGDLLTFSVANRDWPAGRTNHVGAYVGNQTFIHHLYRKESCEDAFTRQWHARVTAVLRHPDAARKNAERFTQNAQDLLDILPDHVRRRFIQVPPATVLERDPGEGGADTSGQQAGRTAKRKRKSEPDVSGQSE